MLRFIAFTALVLSIIAGVVLNITAAINSGKTFLELATLNDLGVAFLIWGQYPLAAAIIITVALTASGTLVVTKK